MSQPGTLDETQRKALVQAAQDLLRDERHWTVVGSEDRAENGICLAELVLQFLNVEEDDCPPACEECKEHTANVE